MAPMNMANMPMQLVNELRKRGHTAEHVQYTLGKGHKFGYALDKEVNIKDHGGRVNAHAHTLKSYLERDFDIFHFWNKTLFFNNFYKENTGLDLPLIKSRNKRIAYRFTGYDARLPSIVKPINKYSPFHHGYEHLYDEAIQKKYHAFLEEYVDQFIVQDPEMGQFAKNAKIVPRALDLSLWKPHYPEPNECPLIVHAPSKPLIKGTKFVESAIEDLQKEGLNFSYKRIENYSHQAAIDLYKKADIIVDQILIGATGVLTLEGWALGKPVVVFLREDLFNEFYSTSDLPVGNANPDTIKDVLRELLEDYQLRLELGKRGRALVEKYHSLPTVTDGLVKIYSDMMALPVHYPVGTADVDYLQTQTLINSQSKSLARESGKLILYRKNELGIIRAKQKFINAQAISKKISTTEAFVEEKKQGLLNSLSNIEGKQNDKDIERIRTLVNRYITANEHLQKHQVTMQGQINLARQHISDNTVAVNKAPFESLNASERMVLIDHLVPKWVVKLAKPLIVLRRIIKYGKIKPG